MATIEDNLVDWLRDAHAMEQQAEQMLKAQAGRLEHYPQLKARIEEHLQETLGQQQLLEECLARHDTKPSVVKDLMGRAAAFGQAIGGATNSDEVVKGAMASYVFENMEISSYCALIAAAELAGDTQTVEACNRILPQEQAMAQWLLDHLPQVTQQFLQRSADPDATAKR
ncbi:MAG: ferritin-like domain-containing protein [Luteimonas sp.]